MRMQSFLVQPPTNCHGSVPSPAFAHLTYKVVRLCQAGQWFADYIMVAHMYQFAIMTQISLRLSKGEKEHLQVIII